MKKEVQVTFDVGELMYDIMNKTYLTGRTSETAGMSPAAASDIQATEDEEDINQLQRSLTHHFASLQSVMGEYLADTESSTNNQIHTAIENGGELTLTFRLPSNFDHASTDALGANIHAYLVYMTLADWFVIAQKEEAQGYLAQASAALETAQRALYKRSRPTRPDNNEN